MDGVCDDNNLIHVRKMGGLINTTYNGEKFGFSRHDINHIVIDLSPKGWTKTNSCIGVTQENSMEISLQSSLLYILLLMVHTYYCAPYPK